MTQREQSWVDDDAAPHGRVVLLTRNPISEAMVVIARATGRPVVLIEPDEQGRGLAELHRLRLTHGDAVVICDHDAPDALPVLRAALDSAADYVAMMASRRRAAGLLAELGQQDAPGLDKLHVPAGLDTGGKAPGEIALSVVAEIIAESHGRLGGPLRAAAQREE